VRAAIVGLLVACAASAASAACSSTPAPAPAPVASPPAAASVSVSASASTAPVASAAPAADAAHDKQTRLIARMLRRVEAARGLQSTKPVPGVLLDRKDLIARVKDHVTRELPAEALDPARIDGLIARRNADLLAENLRLKALLTPDQRRALDAAAG